jgi:hypothetical protein
MSELSEKEKLLSTRARQREDWAADAMKALIIRDSYVRVLNKKGCELIAETAFILAECMQREGARSFLIDLFAPDSPPEEQKEPEEQNEPELFRPISRRRWTFKEVKTLVARSNADVPHTEIAEELGRTTTAIQVALYKLQNGAALGPVNREKKK